jgi:hypothetical protein
MAYKKKNVRPGPKSPFNPSLGPGISEGFSLPKPINALLKLRPIKRLLNWMVMDEGFQRKILDQVPEYDPPEPLP